MVAVISNTMAKEKKAAYPIYRTENQELLS